MSAFKAFPTVGSEAPAFSLRDATGSDHSTAAARGQWLVIYFYPKDDTPGCTIEACEFRDAESALQQAGALVWGVSPDDQSSKAAFRDKFSLIFPIRSDLDHQVAEAYGVWGEKQMMGKSFMSTHRVTFLVNPEGQIARVWESVTPTGHAAQVLAEITSQRG